MQEPNQNLENGTFDLVVSNPPFWPADSGRLPSEEERQIACHEILVDLNGVVATASRPLHPKRGKFCMVYPSRRIDDVIRTLHNFGLNASRALFVHPHTDMPAQMVLLEARRGHQGQLTVLSLWVCHHSARRQTLSRPALPAAACVLLAGCMPPRPWVAGAACTVAAAAAAAVLEAPVVAAAVAVVAAVMVVLPTAVAPGPRHAAAVVPHRGLLLVRLVQPGSAALAPPVVLQQTE